MRLKRKKRQLYAETNRKMRTLLILSALLLHLIANAETHESNPAEVQHSLDRTTVGYISAAKEYLLLLEATYKQHLDIHSDATSNWAEKALEFIKEARKSIDAFDTEIRSNKNLRHQELDSIKINIEKNFDELDKMEMLIHTYARCSHLAEASQIPNLSDIQKSAAELLEHFERHSINTKKRSTSTNACNAIEKPAEVKKVNAEILKTVPDLKTESLNSPTQKQIQEHQTTLPKGN